MDIFGKLRDAWVTYRQKRAEREALRLLVARGDRCLLRDAGFNLVEGSHPHLEPLPQTKERRWAAPLIRLPPPSPRKRGEEDVVAPASSLKAAREKPAA